MFGTYQSGDELGVERVGTTIYYKKNGTTIYTSGTASNGDLLVDAAIYTTGGTIADVMISGDM